MKNYILTSLKTDSKENLNYDELQQRMKQYRQRKFEYGNGFFNNYTIEEVTTKNITPEITAAIFLTYCFGVILYIYLTF
tara:strand:+ start:55 stop:291 length:237 start_codon:yes stop_codon:yes gene_type:complete